MAEQWRPVLEFVGYEVSDQGRVRSWLPRGHQKKPLCEPRILRSCNDPSKKHVFVALRVSTNRTTTRCVHTLVLKAFVGPPVRGMCCRHKDGDFTNNRLSNLEWNKPLRPKHYKKRGKHE